MGFRLVNSVALGAKAEHGAYFETLIFLASVADDTDGVNAKGEHTERGRNIFKSLRSIAREVGVDVRNIRKNIRLLEENGWIREHQTTRYLGMYNPDSKTSPKCYELNLSMLARRHDIRNLINLKKINPGTKLYTALLEATAFQEYDWDTRDWDPDRKPRALPWDGTAEDAGPHLWDIYYEKVKNDHIDKIIDEELGTDPEEITDEEIDEYAQVYRF